MDHYERELREALSSPIEAGVFQILTPDDVADGLQRAFVFSGMKIDWETVRGHVPADGRAIGDDGFHRFFAARRDELGGNQVAYYLNDNQIDCAFRASLFTFERHLDAFISIPAHHYFVAEDFSWCIAYTMEGDADFGWSARKS
jgi:hypothetical protein